MRRKCLRFRQQSLRCRPGQQGRKFEQGRHRAHSGDKENVEGTEGNRRGLEQHAPWRSSCFHRGGRDGGILRCRCVGLSRSRFYARLLPPLHLRALAMRLNVDLTGRRFWQVLLRAVLGVLIGCSLNRVVIKQVLLDGWDWPICFVMGAILSATDPVAVLRCLSRSASHRG